MGALEAATGLALLATPSLPVSLLLGVSLDTPGAATVGRVAGAALVALGVAFWLARGDGRSRAGRALLAAMLLYNVTAVALLVHSRLGLGLSGVGLWPVVILHAALAAWSLACLRPSSSTTTDPARR
jgi:hypothetical protein